MGKRSESTRPSAPSGWGRFVRLRPRVWGALVALAAVGVGFHFVWRQYGPVIARHPQYQLTAEDIRITPPPPWIRADVQSEVVRDAGLADDLSVLEDWEALCRRVADAFEFHPWVASVERIHRRLPRALEVELNYRRPAAAVEWSDAEETVFLPVDAHGVCLPADDFSEVELRYLPRISGITGRPRVGDTWRDERVLGGAKLAWVLSDVWHGLRLVQIVPSGERQGRDTMRYHTFEIITSGGTRIVWGAAPGEEQWADESPFDVKRQRLLDFANSNGQLATINGPEAVDVRTELRVTPRTARRTPAKDNNETRIQ